MNRFLSILLVFSLLFSLAACGADSKDDGKKNKKKNKESTSVEEIGGENVTDSSDKKTNKPNKPNKKPSATDDENTTSAQNAPVQVPVTEGSGNNGGNNSGSNGGNNGGSNNGGNNGGNNAPVVQQNEIEISPLAVYQRAAAQIANSGVAGYNSKSWQKLEGGLSLAAEGSLVNSLLGGLKSTLTDLINGFVTSEADASVYSSAKGSSDAKNRMPISNCSADYIQSVTVVKSGENYKVTIVMRDQQNPKKSDTDGVRVMSKNILYMEDVEDTVKNDSTVAAVIKEMKDGTIDYVGYTITAIMTADGKFVSIDHDCTSDFNVTINAVAVGVIYMSGNISFHTRYTDFVY